MAATCFALVRCAVTCVMMAGAASFADLDPSVGSRPPVSGLSIPEGVRDFLASRYPSVVAEQHRLITDGESEVEPEYTLLYLAPIKYPETSSRAWLVGLRIARIGNGRVPVNRVVIVDDPTPGDKRRLPVDLPTECAGDDCVAFEVKKDVWAYAMSYYDGRHVSNDVRIYSVTTPPRQLLRYGSRLGGPAWYSTLNFADIDGDGVREICVERVVRDFDAHEKWTEFGLYRYDSATNAFGSEKRISPTEFRQIAKRANGSPRLWQYGIPYEERVDEGLKIIEPPIASTPEPRLKKE